MALTDFVTQALVEQYNKASESLGFSKKKPVVTPQIEPQPSTENVSRETTVDDSPKLPPVEEPLPKVDTAILPEDKKPLFSLQNINSDVEFNDENREEIKAKIDSDYSQFTPEEQKEINSRIQNKVGKDSLDQEKLNIARNEMFIQSFMRVDPDTRKKVYQYSEKMGFSKEDQKEFMTQVASMKGKDQVDAVFAYIDSGNEDLQKMAFKDFKEIIVNVKPEDESDPNSISDKVKKMKDDLEKNVTALKTNDKLRDLASDPKIKDILSVNTDDLLTILGDQGADDKVGLDLSAEGIKKYSEDKLALVKDTIKTGLHAGGNMVGFVFGTAQRDSQIGSAGLLLFKSTVSSDKQSAEAYKFLSDTVYNEALKDTAFGLSWVPPKKSYDSVDLMAMLIGKEDVPKEIPYSLTDADPSNPIKSLLQLNNKMTANVLIVDKFMNEKGIDTFELYRRYMHNIGVTTMGFAADFAASPLGLLSEVLKVGGQGAKTTRLAAKEVASVSLFKDKLVEASKLMEDSILKSFNNMTKTIEFKDIENALKYSGDMYRDVSKMTDAEIKEYNALMEFSGLKNNDIIKMRDLSTIYNQLSGIKDQLLMAEAKLAKTKELAPLMMLEEQQTLVTQVVGLVDEFKNLSMQAAEIGNVKIPQGMIGKKAMLKGDTAQVVVLNGLARVSKQGQEVMKGLKSGTNVMDYAAQQAAEIEFAKKAIENPKLLDGGIKFFGLEIPGTKHIEYKLKDLAAKNTLGKRFPTGNLGTEYLFNKAMFEYEGRTALAQQYYSRLKKGLTETDDIRASFAVELGKTDLLDDNLKAVALEAKARTDGMYVEAMESTKEVIDLWRKRGISDDVVDGLIDLAQNGEVSKERIARWEALYKSQGMNDKEINAMVGKHLGDLEKVNLAGDYIKDYQTLIYKNKKGLNKLYDYADEWKKTGSRSTDAYYGRLNVGKLDNFAKSRLVDNRVEAFKIFDQEVADWYNKEILPNLIKMDKKAQKKFPNFIVPDRSKMTKEGVSAYIDQTVETFIKTGDKGLLANIKKIAKLGLDPELSLAEIMASRYGSSNKAMVRRRLNIDLSKNAGMSSTMQEYMDDASYMVEANATEFKGALIPSKVKNALIELDQPSLKKKIKMELEARSPYVKSLSGVDKSLKLDRIDQVAGRYLALGSLEALDTVNGWWKTMNTAVNLQFHFRNAFSNTLMQYYDNGISAFSPATANKTLSLISNKNVKGFGKDMLFKNKNGQLATGEEMLKMMYDSGLFSDVMKKAEYMDDDVYKSFFTKNPMYQFGQGVEDFARAQNFIISWEKGFSPMHAAMNSARTAVNYSNTTKFQREFTNRVIPFMTFYRENFKNSLRYFVKNPDRVLKSARIVPHMYDMDIKDPTQYGQQADDYNKVPVFGEEYTDPKTGKVVVDQMTSANLPFEAMFRFADMAQKSYHGLMYLSNSLYPDAQKEVRDAAKSGIDQILPAVKLPILALDGLMDGALFRNEKVDPVLHDYLVKVPEGVRVMMGMNAKLDKKSGELYAEWSPFTNIIFEMSGGLRQLKKLDIITDDEIEAGEKMQKLLSTQSLKVIDIEKAKQIELQMTDRRVKKIEKIFIKDLNNAGKESLVWKEFKKQVDAEEEPLQ